MIDLHCHSTASDGEKTPSEIVGLAVSAGLSAVALTDHDTMDGLDEFMEAAGAAGLEGVPGVELSCAAPLGLQVHLLGLFIDRRCGALLEALELTRRWRAERNAAMVHRLSGLGIKLDEGELLGIARENSRGGKTFIGRPHMAEALVRRGYCKDKREAFSMYLGKNARAYVPRRTLDVRQSIGIIHEAGGLAVLAHSLASIGDRKKHQATVEALVAMSLDGIEVMYPDYSPLAMRKLNGLADARGLLKSGGTDYHGPATSPGICLGTGRSREGRLMIPDSYLEAMKAKLVKL